MFEHHIRKEVSRHAFPRFHSCSLYPLAEAVAFLAADNRDSIGQDRPFEGTRYLFCVSFSCLYRASIGFFGFLPVLTSTSMFEL